MAINISQSFHRTSANPIDDTFALTKAQMLTVNDNLMPNKYLTICQDDGAIYLYDKSATPSATTGKFTKFEGGSGSSLPSGGTTGQILAKKSNADGDVEWKDDNNTTIQVSALPMASVTELGKIYQFVGTSTSSLTNGFFYECVTDGSTYSWKEKAVSKDTQKTIKDNDISVTDRNTINLTDFDISDDSTNEQTDIKSHRLTPAELADIMANPPGSAINDGNPVGTVISFMGINAPYGYLACDGTEYNIVDYAGLANHITAQFGSVNFFGGDGTTTFAVPDLRGEFLRGTGTNSHEYGGVGSDVGLHQAPTLNNTILGNISTKKISERGVPDGGSNLAYINMDARILASELSGSQQVATAAGTLSTPESTTTVYHTSRPTNTSVLYCIKY